MQFRFLFHVLSLLIVITGLSMMLPLVFALAYGETDAKAFFISMCLSMASGGFIYFSTREPNREITHKEGFAIVGLGWMVVALFGCLPYFFSGTFNSFTDAYFEAVSGFTTTGSTVLTNIESVSHSVLLWRSFTQWFGGMGIILLSIAILPLLGVGGMQLYKAEVPGPVTDKLKPRIGETAKLLWKVYLFFTFLEFILLRAGGMSYYDAICHSFTTMATGGFSTKNVSIESFDSAYIEVVITLFMLLAGANFALHYQALTGRLKSVLKDSELRFYLSIIFLSTAFVLLNLCFTTEYGFWKSLRLSAFQVVSIITTTGYSSTDFEQWSEFAKYFIFLLLFVGGCAGSTGGGMKMLRIFLLLKQGYRELYRLIHPHAVIHVKFNQQKVSSDIMDSIWGFFSLYMFIFVVAALIMSLLGLDMISAVSSVATSIGNVGPGLGSVGPYDNFAHLPAAGKWVLTLCMILGRLELYTLLVLFLPEYWRK